MAQELTPKPAAECRDMAELRLGIDALDRALVELLRQRAVYIDRAIEIKSAAGLPARIESRIEDVVARVRAAAAEGGLDPELAEELWRRLIDWAIRREEQVLGAGGADGQAGGEGAGASPAGSGPGGAAPDDSGTGNSGAR